MSTGGENIMSKQKWHPEEKLTIMLEGLKNESSIVEICRRHGVNQTQYYKWRDQFLSRAKEIFNNGGQNQEVSMLKSLRSGNISQVKVVPHIIEECLKKLPYPIYRIRIRGDSIFYSHSFTEDYLEKENIYYSIEAFITGPIREKLEQIKYSHYKSDWEIGEFYYQPTAHGHVKWIKPHRFVAQRRPLSEDSEGRSQLKLFKMKNYGYRVVITNLKLKNRHIWNFHSKRSQGAEQNIKELKMNYPLAKIPTHKYTTNISYFQILLFAFNIINWFKWLCLPEEYHYKTLQTLRERLLCVQARLTKTGNKNMLRFPAGYLYKDLYAEALKNINKIKQI